jgi:Flp pilus assembly protein TadG
MPARRLSRGSATTRVGSRSRIMHEESGAAAVEFAIVASLFFMLVFAIIDFGFGFHTWNGTAHAAREGARLAAVDPDPAAIEGRVRQAAGFLDQTKLTVSVQCSHSGGGFSACPTSASSWTEGDYVRVIVDYDYPYITPLPGFVGLGNDLELHSQSEVRFEGA